MNSLVKLPAGVLSSSKKGRGQLFSSIHHSLAYGVNVLWLKWMNNVLSLEQEWLLALVLPLDYYGHGFQHKSAGIVCLPFNVEGSKCQVESFHKGAITAPLPMTPSSCDISLSYIIMPTVKPLEGLSMLGTQ